MKCYYFNARPVYATVEVLTDESCVVDEDSNMEGQWWISDFFSKEKRSGKARECMNRVFEAAKAAGIQYIGLHPWARDGIAQEALVKFYESCGFVDCGYAFVKKV